ncbi:MAG: hypothetical protein HOP29_06625 [Phycisphaerales bacterium]|nr:hypothetical protein [Phycisphaerales bacterium]
MSVNRYRPHLYVIPEDDADRQIADGFVLHPRVAARQVQVVEPAGGWARVLETFNKEYVPLLQQNAYTHVVMLIDFDGKHLGRRANFEAEIPEALRTRVFVIGPRDTPVSLKQSLGRGYEDIGRLLADDCDGDLKETWDHELLRHNEADRLRLLQSVKPFLFD